MQIELIDISKKYHRSYLFKNIKYTFNSGQSYAILGSNGSGKSTLLKLISGYVSPTKGSVKWFDNDQKEIERVHYHRHFGFTSPYLELFEELTLEEHLKLHFKLKPLSSEYDLQDVIAMGKFEKHKSKQLKHFSSGMLQRLKLCLALCSKDEVLLLDEPCTNLDEKGVAWYRELVREQMGKKLIIVASNQSHEYDFCEQQIDLNAL
jgi:ABC-type multidrug transport system ATPase subunit